MSSANEQANGHTQVAGIEGSLNPGDAGYRLLFDLHPDPMWVYDVDTLRFLAVNDSAVKHYGYSPEQFLAMRITDLRPEEDRPVLARRLQELEGGADGIVHEWRHLLADGTVIDVEVGSEELPFRGRRSRVVVARDITERKRIAAQLERRTAQQIAVAGLGRAALEGASASELMDQAVKLVAESLELEFCELLVPAEDRDSLVLRAGVGWRGGLVRTARVPIGSEFHPGYTWSSLGQIVVEDYAVEQRFRPTRLLTDHGVVSGICVLVGAHRQPIGVLGAHSSTKRVFTHDELGFLQAIANVLAEAISRHRADADVQHRALHDHLTGLPNRTLLLERFERWVARAQRKRGAATLLFVDVDNFKLINDGLGHAAGDQLLMSLAARLKSVVRPSDTVARVGGDEFVLLCEDAGSEAAAVDVVTRIMAAVSEPFALGGREQHVAASVGIAMADTSSEASVVIQDADAAMYRAKELGGARFELFDAAMRSRSLRRLELESELRRALERHEFHNLYQPLVRAGSDRPVAVEALVRWEHPERGTISPAEFIPVAEETGLIVEIGRQVLMEACRQVAEWSEVSEAGAELEIAVNLSPRQVADPSLVEDVAHVLEATGLEPARLSLEITETAIINDADATGVTLVRLKELGVHLVLDDFGTGYSSLSHAKHFPIDQLKIDRSFVDGLGRDAGDSAIVAAVISMGRALDLSVVAEGVETEAQAEQLWSLGCPLAQGYLFARPLSAEAAAKLLTESS